MVVINALTAASVPFTFAIAQRTAPRLTPAIAGLMAFGAVLNVVFAIALLRWRRWGFYGFVGTTTMALAINLFAGLNVSSAIFGLGGVIFLAVLLHIGGEHKAWPHLK